MVVVANGFELSTSWSRTKFQTLLRSMKFCGSEVIDNEPVAKNCAWYKFQVPLQVSPTKKRVLISPLNWTEVELKQPEVEAQTWWGNHDTLDSGLNDMKNEYHYLEVLVSLPQHSGRAGKEERSHPPPRAWTSVTASTMRRPRIFTAVTSSERAAL
jgi:hypothetical protein